MCHAKLGDRTKAKDCFERAVRWWEKQKGLSPQYVEDSRRSAGEAESVLQAKWRHQNPDKE